MCNCCLDGSSRYCLGPYSTNDCSCPKRQMVFGGHAWWWVRVKDKGTNGDGSVKDVAWLHGCMVAWWGDYWVCRLVQQEGTHEVNPQFEPTILRQPNRFELPRWLLPKKCVLQPIWHEDSCRGYQQRSQVARFLNMIMEQFGWFNFWLQVFLWIRSTRPRILVAERKQNCCGRSREWYSNDFLPVRHYEKNRRWPCQMEQSICRRSRDKREIRRASRCVFYCTWQCDIRDEPLQLHDLCSWSWSVLKE